MNFSWQLFSTKCTVVPTTNLLRRVNIFIDKGFLGCEKLGYGYHISITNKQDTSPLLTIKKRIYQQKI